jgi:hypothetical protein
MSDSSVCVYESDGNASYTVSEYQEVLAWNRVIRMSERLEGSHGLY